MSEAAAGGSTVQSNFGGNEWLIDEMYAQYRQDPSSVSEEWKTFFATYQAPAEAKEVQVKPAAPPATAPTPVATAETQAAPQEKSAKKVESPSPVESEDIRADLPPSPPQPEAIAPTAPYVNRQEFTPRSTGGDDDVQRLRGPAARIVTNMETSLGVPTATSVRSIPAKVLIDNRIVINNHLSRTRGGKISFTHLIGYAVVEALGDIPSMNAGYREVDGKPGIVHPAQVNFGLAIDLPKSDGTRQLLVPNIKGSESMDFNGFWEGYEEIVKKARSGKLAVTDFAETTITLTNPGTIGTVHSVPRLMSGQGTIIGVGAMDYPAEYQGASPEHIASLGVSKILTLTSTYDHRIIQGADSGEFLRIIHQKLLGNDGFYDRIFSSLRIPYEPVRWAIDQSEDNPNDIGKTAQVARLIHSYRSRGHLIADTDPLAYRQRKHTDLDVQTHGLTLWDLERTFPVGGFGGQDRMTLRDILGLLRSSYCRTIGSEYMHLHDAKQRAWLQRRLESGWSKPDQAEQIQILGKLNEAEAFETFLQTKYVGQKRFSLEGGESLIPMLDRILQRAAEENHTDVAIGMPHRGRLNVLANVAGKSYTQIFAEFEAIEDPRVAQGSGDVKYHLGTEGIYTAPGGETTSVYLAANPSHLEAVDGVLEGIVRAKQDRMEDFGGGFNVLPILIHGDAAFAGQGVVMETLNMSQLRGYRTGGTIHVLVNNQIGFTTGASSSRSTLYATDIAKGLQVPVFHVNGDDPEAVAHVAELAFDYREEFNKDVIIDLVCYRRRGHNEGDDPSMTQPVMYNLVDNKRSVRTLYTEGLVGRGDITEEEAKDALTHFQGELERAFAETRSEAYLSNDSAVSGLEVPESQREDAGMVVGWKTAIEADVIEHIGQAHVRTPAGFNPHPKLKQLLDRRAQMSTEGGIDWGFGELLAFGSLVLEQTPVRLSGQDSRRGTFVQRHAVLHDHETGAEWTPLAFLSSDQAKFTVFDSPLSEYATLAFEYGYSVERPDALVLWEAQFGDFVNGAQTVIDEFITSAETKWAQNSSVVLLLPHGYEGQGPDHSSGRIERFLQMCAEDNMIVAQPSTPANHFHLLRRQAYQRPRKPLVVFTPKQLLRLRAAASSVEDFTSGTFQPVIGDAAANPEKVTRVLLSSGRVYYDLLAERKKRGDDSVALVRLEQLFPLELDQLVAELDRYPNAEVVWVQDEPKNQGPYSFLALELAEHAPKYFPIKVVSRPAAAAPSTGSTKVHQVEQAKLVNEAFTR